MCPVPRSWRFALLAASIAARDESSLRRTPSVTDVERQEPVGRTAQFPILATSICLRVLGVDIQKD